MNLRATIVNGQLVFDNPALWAKVKEKHSGHKIILSIKKEPKKTRTLQQNRYYRAILAIIADETGNDPDDLHEFFKFKLNRKYTTFGGEVGGSTTQLDTAQMTKYIDRVRQFALDELNISTPSPEEENLMEYLASEYGV